MIKSNCTGLGSNVKVPSTSADSPVPPKVDCACANPELLTGLRLLAWPDPGPRIERTLRGRGEIGRRAGFRCRWAKVLGGSSPSARTEAAPRLVVLEYVERQKRAD